MGSYTHKTYADSGTRADRALSRSSLRSQVAHKRAKRRAKVADRRSLASCSGVWFPGDAR